MLNKIKNFFYGSFEEFKKVIWPSRQEVMSHTIIVVVTIIISTGIITAVDYGLFNLIQVLIVGRGV